MRVLVFGCARNVLCELGGPLASQGLSFPDCTKQEQGLDKMHGFKLRPDWVGDPEVMVLFIKPRKMCPSGPPLQVSLMDKGDRVEEEVGEGGRKRLTLSQETGFWLLAVWPFLSH